MKPGVPGLAALLEEATRFASAAAGKVMANPRGQEAVARAVGLAQKSLQRFEALQAEVMRAAGIPGRQDYQELARSLARLKRKARELTQKLEAQRRAGAGTDHARGRGESVDSD